MRPHREGRWAHKSWVEALVDERHELRSGGGARAKRGEHQHFAFEAMGVVRDDFSPPIVNEVPMSWRYGKSGNIEIN
jgi:hypothetical protein